MRMRAEAIFKIRRDTDIPLIWKGNTLQLDKRTSWWQHNELEAHWSNNKKPAFAYLLRRADFPFNTAFWVNIVILIILKRLACQDVALAKSGGREGSRTIGRRYSYKG